MQVEWGNTGARSWQKLLLLLIHRGPMGRVVSRLWTSALDRHAQSDIAWSRRPQATREPAGAASREDRFRRTVGA